MYHKIKKKKAGFPQIMIICTNKLDLLIRKLFFKKENLKS